MESSGWAVPFSSNRSHMTTGHGETGFPSSFRYNHLSFLLSTKFALPERCENTLRLYSHLLTIVISMVVSRVRVCANIIVHLAKSA